MNVETCMAMRMDTGSTPVTSIIKTAAVVLKNQDCRGCFIVALL